MADVSTLEGDLNGVEGGEDESPASSQLPCIFITVCTGKVLTPSCGMASEKEGKFTFTPPASFSAASIWCRKKADPFEAEVEVAYPCIPHYLRQNAHMHIFRSHCY